MNTYGWNSLSINKKNIFMSSSASDSDLLIFAVNWGKSLAKIYWKQNNIIDLFNLL